jgi:putative flippase GtrA
MRAELQNKIMRFLCVGGLGFCVDAAVLGALMFVGLPATLARIASIACAMTTTYLLNRHFSFKTEQKKSSTEYIRYILVSVASASINYGVYAACLGILPPHAALCVGVACGMLLNFCGYNFWVFGGRKLPA